MTLAGPVTETELCNGALALLGLDERLDDILTAQTVNGRRCRLAFPLARDSMLATYPWNFAGRRASLPERAQAPAWGFAGAFSLPPDFLRLRAIRGADRNTRYVIEQDGDERLLLTDLPGPLDILYTARATNTGLYDVSFIDALTVRLAADLAMPVTQDRALTETLTRLALLRLEEAQLADAREGTVDEQFPDGSWVESRL